MAPACRSAVTSWLRCTALTPLGIALAVVAAVALLVLTPRSAPADSHCPAPGGADITAQAEPEEGHFVFAGRGWGHGVGMSQYGADGAARLGCTAEQIIDGYYEGIDVEEVAAPGAGDIVVGVAPNRPGASPVGTYQATNTGEVTIPWRLRDADGAEQGTLAMPAGAIWRVERGEETFAVHERDGDDWEPVEVAGGDSLEDVERLDVVLESSEGRRLTLDNRHPYRRGTIRFAARSTDAFAVQAHLETIEEYLLGVREVPPGFEPAAQEAQAITARSYAYSSRGARSSNCDCHIYDSTSDQVYAGSLAEPSTWLAAVDATERQVLRRDGRTITANYSSSHGGHSESAEFVWGGTGSPHQQAVDDSRWDLASDNDHRTWELKLTPEEAGSRLKVGTLLSIEPLDPIGAEGRIGWADQEKGLGGARVVGTEDTRHLSGETVRTQLGLRSSLFTVANPPADVLTIRLEGQNRYETAANVALHAFDAATETVYIATGADFADGLAGGSAAVAEDSALLLTATDELPQATRDALDELAPDRLVVLGGPLAVSDDVVTELEAHGQVERRHGGSRYETAAAVARGAFDDTATEAFVATGIGYADALAGGAVAALRDAPVLLVEPDDLPQATRDVLVDLGIDDVTVLGGHNAVSDAVVTEIEAVVGGEVTRLGGQNRFATAVTIASELGERDVAFLATGRAFPDALAAVPASAAVEAPVVLVEPDGPVPTEVEDYLRGLSPEALTVLGGEAAISQSVVDAAVAAAK